MPVVTAQVLPINTNLTQIGPSDPTGTQFGKNALDPIAFFGGNPVAQPTSQGSVVGVPGTVSVVAVTVTALSVAPNTSAEQAFAVTGAAVGQLVAVQKPTVDAGIAVVGVRASATGSVAITYANDTAATVTPTAGQTYTFELIPAAMTISATLTPAAVGPNTMSLQQFAVNGIAAGAAVVVNKPTAQAGLGIVDANVVSAGVVGITFANFTAATSTPTAGESYLFFAVSDLTIAPVYRTLSQTLTPVSVAANTTAEQTFTVTGLPASGQVVVNKPTVTAGLGIGGVRVSAANTLAINYINNTSAAIVPPSEVYTIGSFEGAAPAAGSTTSYNSIVGGGVADHSALVQLGLIAGP
jgi:hypothetical protein